MTAEHCARTIDRIKGRVGYEMNEKFRLFFFYRASAACILVAFVALFSTEVIAMGERYTEQGGRLSAATVEILIAQNFCKTSRECHDFLPGYVAHGDRVRIAFYDIGDKNIQAFNVIIELVIKDGLRITDRVPITIKGYRESHEEYRKSGVFWKDVKPFLILEMNK